MQQSVAAFAMDSLQTLNVPYESRRMHVAIHRCDNLIELREFPIIWRERIDKLVQLGSILNRFPIFIDRQHRAAACPKNLEPEVFNAKSKMKSAVMQSDSSRSALNVIDPR